MIRRLSIGELALISGAFLFVAQAGCGDDFVPDKGAGAGGDDGGSGSAGIGASSGGGSSGATGGSSGAAGGSSGGIAGAAGTTGTDPNGTACGEGDTCQSGHCVDGVCCDQACDAPCQACAAAGSAGTCTPHDPGTDPELECLGAGQAGEACVGACDGQGACAFPDATKSCGPTTCTGGKQTEQLCKGDGTCQQTETACGQYACGATSCKTSCASGSDCAATAWCNATSCQPKQDPGTSCGAADQCKSGFCEGQYCCASACPAPASCQTGACLCGGVACPAGKACITWYLDQDGDGYGASSAFDKQGCEGQAPSDPGGKTYRPSSDPIDCDDSNSNVRPGQTQWFTTPYGTNNWDYNCSGTVEYQYGTTSATTCALCCPGGPCPLCSVGNWYLGGCATNQVNAFASFVGCGQYGTLKSCSNTCQSMVTATAAQGCR
jgi:hypothetical protein